MKICTIFFKGKPEDYGPNYFKTCQKGKLTSIQSLTEKEKVNKNIKDNHKNTPIHTASKRSSSIVQ